MHQMHKVKDREGCSHKDKRVGAELASALGRTQGDAPTSC